MTQCLITKQCPICGYLWEARGVHEEDTNATYAVSDDEKCDLCENVVAIWKTEGNYNLILEMHDELYLCFFWDEFRQGYDERYSNPELDARGRPWIKIPQIPQDDAEFTQYVRQVLGAPEHALYR